jgi:hypothetical protein
LSGSTTPAIVACHVEFVRIRALAVFEGVVYQARVVDATNPCRPTLEVDAVLRAGDADRGPLLVPVPEYVVLGGGPEVIGPCLDELRARGRIVEHLGVAHVAFPFWEPVDVSGPRPAST